MTDTFDWSTYWQSSSQTALPVLDLGIVPEETIDATVPIWAETQQWAPIADGEVDLWSVTDSNVTFDSADAWGLPEDFYSMSDEEWAAQYASMTFNFSDTDGSYMDWNASMYSTEMYDAYFSSDAGLWDESYTSDAFAYTCCEAPLTECTNTTELKDTFVAFDLTTGVGCSMTSEYFLQVLVPVEAGDNIPRVANGVGYYSKPLPAVSTDLPSATGSTDTSVSTTATGGSAASGSTDGQAGSADGALSQAVSDAVSSGTAPSTTAATGTTATATTASDAASAAAGQQSAAAASASDAAVLEGVPEATAAPTTQVSTYTVTTGISLAGK